MPAADALAIASPAISNNIKQGGRFVFVDWVPVYGLDSGTPTDTTLRPAYGYIEAFAKHLRSICEAFAKHLRSICEAFGTSNRSDNFGGDLGVDVGDRRRVVQKAASAIWPGFGWLFSVACRTISKSTAKTGTKSERGKGHGLDSQKGEGRWPQGASMKNVLKFIGRGFSWQGVLGSIGTALLASLAARLAADIYDGIKARRAQAGVEPRAAPRDIDPGY